VDARKQEIKRTRTDGKRDIQERTFCFALEIIRLCRQLGGNPGVGRILALQLLRSGTSVGANVEEAQAGQSRADFISKYAISLKEAREANYWLRLIAEANFIDPSTLQTLLQESYELSRVLGAIVARSKQGSRA
jgi:four helix bundle protein